ncbi:MAG: ATP synthase F1 subunit delta [Acidimicrobiaceae bacterium]|nr:ATP synthase F1 subunit delta [Acidimicrobiaceae bacterium]
MTTPQAPARIYAGALFDIAVENRMVDQIADELRAVSSAIDGLDAQLRGFFEMPQIRKEDKQRVINLAFEGKVSRPVLGLLHVLVDKRREPLLDAIVADFGELVDESEGRVRANVTSASPLDADLADAIRAALEQRTQRRVVLRQRVDPGVLGGIRVSLGDLVIDGTLRRGLLDLRRTLAAAQQ